jgi:H+/Cl- antiporter ClcA
MAAALHVLKAWLQGGWRAAHDIEPEFWRNLRHELLAGRQWADRAIVLVMAAVTGAVVVGFTLLAEAAIHGFRQVEQWGEHGRYLTLLWTPALTVALLWWTRRFVPGAMGSGIPQVVRALEDDLQPSQRAWLASLRVSLHKIGLVSGGLLAGCRSGGRARRCRWAPASW